MDDDNNHLNNGEDCPMHIDFKNLEPHRHHLQTFKDIKNDLIGNEKQAYFDKGLIEQVIPMVTPDTDELVLYECLAILNSFLIQFSKANDVFQVFKI